MSIGASIRREEVKLDTGLNEGGGRLDIVLELIAGLP